MKTSALCLAAIFVAHAAPVFADEAPPANAVPAPPATMSNNLRAKFIDQKPTDRLASKIIGSDIHNTANETIGKVADIDFDEHNTIRAFVVGVGGFLGMGDKYVAVDPSVVQITVKPDKTDILIDTDKDQLKAAPKYRYLSDQKTEKH